MKINTNYLCVSAFMLLLAVAISGCAVTPSQDQETTATVLSADGSPIYFGVKGAGEPALVFVHCWTCNHNFWQQQIEFFSNNHKVIWLDLAGHGQSGSTRTDYTMAAFGEDVAAVVNQANVNKVILVGHSMGGPVSIEAANRLGDKVVAIVGVDTFYTPFEYPESEEEIENFVKPFQQDFAGTSQQMVQSMFTPNADPTLKESIVNEFSKANPEMGISAIDELFKWGAQNVPASLERYADRLKNINAAPTGDETALHESVILIPGVGHFVPQVKPNEFNAALSKIIQAYAG